jgi:hypothetical protein
MDSSWEDDEAKAWELRKHQFSKETRKTISEQAYSSILHLHWTYHAGNHRIPKWSNFQLIKNDDERSKTKSIEVTYE